MLFKFNQIITGSDKQVVVLNVDRISMITPHGPENSLIEVDNHKFLVDEKPEAVLQRIEKFLVLDATINSSLIELTSAGQDVLRELEEADQFDRSTTHESASTPLQATLVYFKDVVDRSQSLLFSGEGDDSF